jgi:hypothetical protein
LPICKGGLLRSASKFWPDFSLDFCHQRRLDGRTSHLFAREYFLLLGA